MDPDKLRRVVESLLFVSDGPLELGRMQAILEVGREDLDAAVAVLVESYQNRGISLQRIGEALQLASAPEAAPYIDKLLGIQQSVRLSTAALETLAIIAYRQPITRSAIEAVRGVNCERALGTLQSRGLVCEVGRLEAVGRPMLYGTTFEFLEYFGLQGLEQLPPLSERSDATDSQS